VALVTGVEVITGGLSVAGSRDTWIEKLCDLLPPLLSTASTVTLLAPVCDEVGVQLITPVLRSMLIPV
jgi:hypothetical protein